MSKFPETWTLSSINDLIGKDDVFIDGDWVESKDQDPDGEVRLIQLADLKELKFIDKSDRHLTYKKALELGCTFLKKDDVLVARMPDPIGRACLFPHEKQNAFVTVVDVAIIRVNPENVSSKWLMYFINAPEFRKDIIENSGGSTRQRISRRNLGLLEFPLPPLPEQKRIVAKLDNLFAHLDQLKVRLQNIPTLLKQFRQAVLTQAVTGKLTEEWRDGKSIDVQNELENHRIKWTNDISGIPNEWRVVELGDYVDNLDGPRIPVSSKEREKRRGKYPYYGATGIIDTIDNFTHDGENLLIGEDGANLLSKMKPLAFITQGKIWVNNHAHVVRCKGKFSNSYLAYFINSIDLSPFVTGTAQPKLTQSKMNSILVPVPSSLEQKEIVRRVESLFEVADRIEASYNKLQEKIDQLPQAILSKAFTGQLIR